MKKIGYDRTDINGKLGTGKMFLFSTSNLKMLLGNREGTRMLDIGAGCGEITKQYKQFFKEIDATEVSLPMITALKSLDINPIKTADIQHYDIEFQRYDLISCLNVLDRCEKPITLLKGNLVS